MFSTKGKPKSAKNITPTSKELCNMSLVGELAKENSKILSGNLKNILY